MPLHTQIAGIIIYVISYASEASSRKKASLGKMKMFIYHSYCYCSAPETIYSRHRLVTKKDESTMKKNEYRKHNKIFFHFMKNGLHHMCAILLCCYEHVSYTCTINIFKLIFLFTTKFTKYFNRNESNLFAIL